MDSEDTVESSEYMTILVKFPENTFTLNTTLDSSFDDYLNMANDGATSYTGEKLTFWDWVLGILPFIFSFGLPILIIILAIRSSIVNGYGYKNNKVIDKKNTPLFRDIPCNKDIYYANTLVKLNNNVFAGYKETNIFGAIILKWVKENKIIFKNETKGVFNKNTSSIDLTLNPTFDNALENELFDVVVSRAVAKINVLLELGCQLSKTGGLFVFMKGNVLEELNNSKNALKVLNYSLENVINFKLPIEESERNIVILKHTSPTSKNYPRQFSTIKKKPL